MNPRLVRLLPVTLALCGALAAGERGAAVRRAAIDVLELSRREESPAVRVVLDPPGRAALPEAPDAAWSAAKVPTRAALAEPSGAVPAYTGFAGILDNLTRVPPDTYGAVSPQHVVAMLNSEVQFQDRSGRVLAKVSLDAFWRDLGPFAGTTFDPRVLYDHAGGRWLATAVADSRRASAALLVGASQTADPTGRWNLFRIDVGSTGAWADFPIMGFNGRWAVVSVNLFRDDTYFRTHLYAFDKAELYRGERALYTLFTDTSGSFVPAVDLDGVADRLLLAQSVRSFSGAGGLRVSEIRGSLGAESFQAGTRVAAVNDFWSNAPEGNFLPQRGTSELLDAGDSRMQNCVARFASLWCAHTVFLPSGTPTRAAVQWWQVDPGTGQVLQRGRVEDAAGTYHYAYPSIAVNRNRGVLVGFSRFSAGEYASAAFAWRSATDPPGTLGPEVVFKPGEAAYQSTTGSRVNRWGDYSATVVDPADDTGFWTIQQYAATPPAGSIGRWGTWWAQVLPPSSQECAIVLGARGELVAGGGGRGTIAVSAPPGCPWMAASNASWIAIESGARGSGSGTVAYLAAANIAGGVRTGTITIAGQTFTVTQGEPTGLPDLIVSALAAPQTAFIGTRIAVSLTVRNQGAVRAGPFRVGLYLFDAPAAQPQGAPLTACTLSDGLAGGQSIPCSGSLAIPATLEPGPWYLAAVADDQRAVAESDESNNTRVGPAIAVTGPRPVNAASYRAGAVSPGEIVTFFGSNIGPAAGVGLRLDASGRVATELGGTRVLFDGIAAPMIWAQANQVSAVVPFSVAGRAATDVEIEFAGARNGLFRAAVAPASPALFALDASGRGQGAIVNQDGTLNSPGQPAEAGSVVAFYATGLGLQEPPLADGEVAGRLTGAVLPVRVIIGGVEAEVLYAGAAPGTVAGVFQVNARVPAGAGSGPVPVAIAAGPVVSPMGVFLTVR